MALLWLGLTALDGRTYHLAPALVAGAPAIAGRLLGLSVAGGGLVAASLALAGVMTVGAAWGLLELTGILPSATVWSGQPGGVRAEMAVMTLAGALAGMLANRPLTERVQHCMRKDPDVRRFVLSAAFFVACVGGVIVLALVGLWH